MRIRFEPRAPALPQGEHLLRLIADALRARRGDWALIGRYDGPASNVRQWAHSIRQGGPTLPGRAFGPGFEAQTCLVAGERRVYVRYVGPNAENGGAS